MTEGIGHNGGPLMGAAQNQLKSILERLERLDEEKDEISAQSKEVYAEAKGNGFDNKIIRKIVAIRKKDRNKVIEEKELLALYAHALGIEDLV